MENIRRRIKIVFRQKTCVANIETDLQTFQNFDESLVGVELAQTALEFSKPMRPKMYSILTSTNSQLSTAAGTKRSLAKRDFTHEKCTGILFGTPQVSGRSEDIYITQKTF